VVFWVLTPCRNPEDHGSKKILFYIPLNRYQGLFPWG